MPCDVNPRTLPLSGTPLIPCHQEGFSYATPHAMDDFTIILPALPDITSCDLKAYDGLYRLWRMVERYKMTTPITITVVDNAARHVREIRGDRIQAGAWRLQDTPTAATPLPIEGEFKFPLTIHVQIICWCDFTFRPEFSCGIS